MGIPHTILIFRQGVQTYSARYVPRHRKPDLCPETLAIAWSLCDYSKVVIAMRCLRCRKAPFIFLPTKSVFMNQSFNRGGRPPKLNCKRHRYVVRFDDVENNVFLAQYERSGASDYASFIKGVLLGKSFKVFVVDENTRSFIDKLSSLNAHYRTIAIDYDITVKTLRDNFTEKKAMRVLYNLERHIIELVKLNREIVALAKDFDERWLRKSF